MLKHLAPLCVLLAAGMAQAQFNCPVSYETGSSLDCEGVEGGCVVSYYGLSQPDSNEKEVDPFRDVKIDRGDPIAPFSFDDFGGTFAYGRDNGRPNCSPENPANCECGGEDGFLPIFGTFVYREYALCDPADDTSPGYDSTSTPPGCPVETAFDLRHGPLVCNANSTASGASCTTNADCPQDPLAPGNALCWPRDPDFFFSSARVIASQPPITVIDTDGDGIPDTPLTTELHITVSSVGNNCGVGRRIVNPDPDAAAGSTRIRWTNWGNEGGSGSHICCNSSDFPFNICSSLSGIEVPRYPAVPALTSFGGPYSEFSDMVFEAGYDSNWIVDQNHWVDGQRYGVCENRRDIPCDCGVGGACLGAQIETALNPCPSLDADPVTGGLQPDACDVTDFRCEVNRDTVCDCSDADPATPGDQLIGPNACYLQADVGCTPVCVDRTTTCTDDADCAAAGLPGSCSPLQNPTCVNPCPALGDFCDPREFGWRLGPEGRLDPMADGRPDPNICTAAPYVFKGFYQSNCSISALYENDGDPGPACDVLNFKRHFRPDVDCNVVDDTTEGPNPPGDLCPHFTEVDLLGDSVGNGIGDACRCGDSNRDGVIDVADILDINDLIFNDPGAGTSGLEVIAGIPPIPGIPPGFGESSDPLAPSEGYKRVWSPLSDTNHDPPDPGDPGTGTNFNWDTGGDINVIDILNVNSTIFDGPQLACARYPICGDGAVDPGLAEGCDDGNNDSGDGCDNTCAVEFGFTCSGEPSICTN